MVFENLSQRTKGIISIIGACFLYLPVGSTYILGNINVYVSSYFEGVTSDETNIVFPITTIVGNLVAFISLPLIKIVGFRALLITATILTWVFIFASSYCTNFWVFFVLFGMGYGGTTGFLYLTLMYNGYKYFPKRRGLVGGILMGVYGISSLISNFILLALMNPDNVKAIKDSETNDYYFPEEISSRLPNALRVLSYYFLGVMLIGNCLQFEYKPEECNEAINPEIKEDQIQEDSNPNSKIPLFKKKSLHDSVNREVKLKEEKNPDNKICTQKEKNYDISENSNNETKSQTNFNMMEKRLLNQVSSSSQEIEQAEECKSFPHAFHSLAFYVILTMIFFSIQNGYFTASNFKNYGLSKISDDTFLTLVGSLSCVFNGGGRFFWGIICDRWSFKRVYLIILSIQIIEIATIRFISSYKATYLIWVCVALLCEGGHFVIFPPLCLKVFGTQPGSRVYSVVLLAIALGNFTQFAINLGLRQLIGFDNEFLIFLGFSIISWLLCIGTNIKFKTIF